MTLLNYITLILNIVHGAPSFSKPLNKLACMHFDFQMIPNPNEFYKMARTRLFDKYKKEWQNEISTLSSLDNFVKFKHEHGLEDYFSVVKDKRHLTALCQFRLRSHNLAIETGRHSKTPRERRLCIYCNSEEIEDEVHFLLFCSFYDELRRPLIPLISELNTHDAFVFLLHSTAPNITRSVAKFIYLAFNKRNQNSTLSP